MSLEVEVKGSNLEFDRGKFESSLQSSIIKLVKFWIFNIIMAFQFAYENHNIMNDDYFIVTNTCGRKIKYVTLISLFDCLDESQHVFVPLFCFVDLTPQLDW